MEQAIRTVCGRLGIEVKRIPSAHAGGKWRLSFESVLGRSAALQLDMNFLLRTPLWPPTSADSRPIGSFRATKVPVLELHELAAGKIAALFARNACRDLFDTRELLLRKLLDPVKLRTAFMIYGGINRKDWRTIALDDVAADPEEVDLRLIPMLREDVAPRREKLVQWTKQLVSECRDLLSSVLPLNEKEREFLDRLNDGGEIAPNLLTDDARLRRVIGSHPGLQWKALNVKKRLGQTGDEGLKRT